MAAANCPALLISVVGLSRSRGQLFNEATGIGKSCLCFRFVYPEYDDYIEGHPSILALHEFESSVINSQHSLYWGSVTKSYPIKGKDQNIQFHILEQTVFYQDITSQPFTIITKPDGLEMYNRRVCGAIESPGKFSYKMRDGISLHDDYEKQQYPQNVSKLPRGFLVVVDVSQGDADFDKQLERTEHLLDYLHKHKRKFIIVATKRDCFNPDSMEKLYAIKRKYKTQIIETSAGAHLNIANAFSLVAHKVLQKKVQGLSDHVTSYEVAAQMTLTEIVAARNSFAKFLKKRVADPDEKISSLENLEQCKECVRVIGKFETEKIFAEHILERYNAKVSTYAGVHGEPELRLEFLEDFIGQRDDLRLYSRNLKSWIERYLQEHPEPSPISSPDVPETRAENSTLAVVAETPPTSSQAPPKDEGYQVFEKHDSGCPTECRTSFDPDDTAGSEFSDSFETDSEHNYENFDPANPPLLMNEASNSITAPEDKEVVTSSPQLSHTTPSTYEDTQPKSVASSSSTYKDKEVASISSTYEDIEVATSSPQLSHTAPSTYEDTKVTAKKFTSSPSIDQASSTVYDDSRSPKGVTTLSELAQQQEGEIAYQNGETMQHNVIVTDGDCPEYVNFDPKAPAEIIFESSDTSISTVVPLCSPAPSLTPPSSPSLLQDKHRHSPDIQDRARRLSKQLGLPSRENSISPPLKTNTPPSVSPKPARSQEPSLQSAEIKSEIVGTSPANAVATSTAAKADDKVSFAKQQDVKQEQQAVVESEGKTNTIKNRAQFLQGLLRGSIPDSEDSKDNEEPNSVTTQGQQQQQQQQPPSPPPSKRKPSRQAPAPPLKPKTKRPDSDEAEVSNQTSPTVHSPTASLAKIEDQFTAETVTPTTSLGSLSQDLPPTAAPLQNFPTPVPLENASQPPFKVLQNSAATQEDPSSTSQPDVVAASAESGKSYNIEEAPVYSPKLAKLRKKVEMRRQEQQYQQTEPSLVQNLETAPPPLEECPPPVKVPSVPSKIPPKTPPKPLKNVVVSQDEPGDPPPLPPALEATDILPDSKAPASSSPPLVVVPATSSPGVTTRVEHPLKVNQSLQLSRSGSDQSSHGTDEEPPPPPIPVRTIDMFEPKSQSTTVKSEIASSPPHAVARPVSADKSPTKVLKKLISKSKSSSPTTNGSFLKELSEKESSKKKKKKGYQKVLLEKLTRPHKPDRSASPEVTSSSKQRMSEPPAKTSDSPVRVSSSSSSEKRKSFQLQKKQRSDEYVRPARFMNMKERPLPAEPFIIDGEVPEHDADEYELIDHSILPPQPPGLNYYRKPGSASVRRVHSFESKATHRIDLDSDFRNKRLPSPPSSRKEQRAPPPIRRPTHQISQMSIDDGYENSDEFPTPMQNRPLPDIPLRLPPDATPSTLDYDYPRVRGVRFFRTLPTRGAAARHRDIPTAASLFPKHLPATSSATKNGPLGRGQKNRRISTPDEYVPMNYFYDDSYINWETSNSLQQARRDATSSSSADNSPSHSLKPPAQSPAALRRYSMDDMMIYVNLPVPNTPLSLPPRQPDSAATPISAVSSSPQHSSKSSQPPLASADAKPRPAPRKANASSLDSENVIIKPKPRVMARARAQTSAADVTDPQLFPPPSRTNLEDTPTVSSTYQHQHASPKPITKNQRFPSARQPPKPLPRHGASASNSSLDRRHYVNNHSFEGCDPGSSNSSRTGAPSIEVNVSLPPNFGGGPFDEEPSSGSTSDVFDGLNRRVSEGDQVAQLPPRNLRRHKS